MVNALQSNNNGIKCPFFEVKDQAGRTRATILGTVHVLPRDLKLSSIILEAFSKADVYMPEQDPRWLEDLWKTLKVLPDSKYPKLGCLDLALFIKAQQIGKETQVLEQEEVRVDHHKDGIPNTQPPSLEEQLDLTLQAVDDFKQGTFKGVEKRLDANFALLRFKPEGYPALKKMIVSDRNQVQAEEIDRYLNRNPEKIAFVTVGLGHLPDMNFTPGVVTLLQQKGWRVVQVK